MVASFFHNSLLNSCAGFVKFYYLKAIALARNLVKQGRYDLPLSTESLLKFPFAQSHPGSCLPR